MCVCVCVCGGGGGGGVGGGGSEVVVDKSIYFEPRLMIPLYSRLSFFDKVMETFVSSIFIFQRESANQFYTQTCSL